MSLFGGWLGAALPVLGAQRAGVQQGQMDSFLLQRKLQQEDEARQREMQQAAMEAQLLQLRVDEAQKPQPWAPTSMDEYMKVHPQSMQTENIDPNSDAGIAARLKYLRGSRQIELAHPAPPSDVEQRQEAEGMAILAQPAGPAQYGPFGAAFQAIRAHHPDWSPGKVAYAANQGALSVNPTIRPSQNDQFGDLPATPTAPAPAPPAPITHTMDPQTREAAAQRWDELVQQGVDPEQAKQQVLREFGGQ